jgi:hypothetical protein
VCEEAEMGKVKSALEIALEKAGEIGGLSREEKERIQEEEMAASVLREFYLGRLDSNGLWQRLKGSRPFVLRTAQISLIETLAFGSLEEEFQRRKQAIVALETLKERPNTAVIESGLNAVAALQKDYEEMREKVGEDLKKQIEKHPQLRMQPVKTPDGKTVAQMTLSVDEAVKSRLAEHLSEHEEEYNLEFSGLIGELKAQID